MLLFNINTKCFGVKQEDVVPWQAYFPVDVL